MDAPRKSEKNPVDLLPWDYVSGIEIKEIE
jgi:hypothetical protein